MVKEYYDVVTGLRVRIEIGEWAEDIQDYRDVKGYKFPFLISEGMGKTVIEYTVKSVEINTNLKDDLFKITQ